MLRGLSAIFILLCMGGMLCAATPSRLTASRNIPLKVELTWHSDTEHAFVSVRRFTEGEDVPETICPWAKQTRFTDLNVTDGIIYSYQVCGAKDASGSDSTSWSETVKGTPFIELSADHPTLVHASQGRFYGQIELVWIPATNPKYVYTRLYRSESPDGPWKSVTKKWLPNNQVGVYDDEGLEPGIDYYYCVEGARDAKGKLPGGKSEPIRGFTRNGAEERWDAWQGNHSGYISTDSLAFDFDGDVLPFERRPKVTGVYRLPGEKRDRTVSFAVLTEFPRKVSRYEVELGVNRNILLYRKDELRRWQSSPDSGTEAFIRSCQSDSLPVKLRCKTRFAERKADCRVWVDLCYRAPFLNDSDSELVLFPGQSVTLSGRYFGMKAPVVRLEARDTRGKLRKIPLKVLKNPLFPDFNGKPLRSYTDPETAESIITVQIPDSLPVGAQEGLLVLDSRCGLAARKVHIQP